MNLAVLVGSFVWRQCLHLELQHTTNSEIVWSRWFARFAKKKLFDFYFFFFHFCLLRFVFFVTFVIVWNWIVFRWNIVRCARFIAREGWVVTGSDDMLVFFLEKKINFFRFFFFSFFDFCYFFHSFFILNQYYFSK